MVVQAEDLQLSDGVEAVVRGSQVYLPVRALALALEFPVEVDVDRARAEGWFLAPERSYAIDAGEGRVSREGVSEEFPAAAFVTSRLDDQRDLYVRPRLLEHAWPVELSVSRADLVIHVEPLEPLPVQQRRAREERQAALRARSGASQDADLPEHEHAYGGLTPPVVGLDVQARSGGGPRAVRQNLRWSQEIAGMNVAAGVSASGPTLDESRVDDARMTLQRFGRGEQWPGGLNRVAAGDVVGESLNRIGSLGRGRGVTLSSFPLVRASAYDLFDLEGNAPSGWEAELYRNGQLLAFQQIGEDGIYSFDGIELRYGVNRLHVVLYGPQGRTLERTKVVDVGQTEARPGATHVRVDHIQQGRDLIDVGRDEDNADTAERAGTSLRAVHGVSRGLSVEAAFLDRPASRGDPAGRYTLLGAAGALGPTATRLRVLGQQDGGAGVDLDTRMRAGPVSLRLGLAKFDAFESPRVGYGDSALTDDLDVAASLPVSLGETRVRFRARYRYALLASQRERQRLRLTQRWNSGSIAWQHDVDIRKSGAEPERWSANLNASDRWAMGFRQSLRWSAGVSYAQDRGITGGRSRVRYRWSRATTLGLRLQRSQATGQTAAGMSWTRQWDSAQFSVTVDGGEGRETTAGLRYSVGFGPGGRGGYTLADPNAPSRGAVAVHVFLDRDEDGRPDPDEPSVPGASLQAPLDRGGSTDERGRLVLHNLEPHRRYAVRLDPKSLTNPFWLPASDGQSVRVRPGSVPVVNLPVQETASISGTVELVSTGSEVTGVPLELRDAAGEVVARTESIFGGFFSFKQVPYGRYEVVIGRGYALVGEAVYVAPTADDPMLSGIALGVETRATTSSQPASGEQGTPSAGER